MDPSRTASAPVLDDDPLDGVRHQLDQVMGIDDAPPVDVRAYLLDPPPTTEELARLERRRALVRAGSIAASAVIAIVLLVPWPSRDPDRGHAGVAAPGEPSPAVEPLDAPVRVDEPPARRTEGPVRRSTRSGGRGRPSGSRVRRRAARLAQAAPVTSSHRSQPPGSAHAPAPPAPQSSAHRAPPPQTPTPPPEAPTPQPAPAPPPTGDAAVLVPVM